jgi:hypothetical protein
VTSRRDRLALEAADRVSGGGVWKRSPCPFCEDVLGSPDPRPQGNWCLNTSTCGWHCYRCGTKGYLPGHGPEDEPEEVEKEVVEHQAPDGFLSLDDDSIMVKAARRYVMKKRGVSERTIKQAQLGACMDGKYAGRVVIPVLDPTHTSWRGFVARKFDESAWGPNALNDSAMDRENLVYNERALHREHAAPVLCVEGPFDALSFWPNAIAFLGKPAEKQIPILEQSKRPLVICLDGDSWGESEGLCMRLKFRDELKQRVGWVKLPPTTDPNTVDPHWLWAEALKSIA